MQLRSTDPCHRGHRRLRRVVSAAAIAAIGVGSLAAFALASSPVTLSLAKRVAVKTKTENVVTNSRGVTVYTLSGENVHHLKCTKANRCFSFWFPVKTGSPRSRLTASHGVRGKLGTLQRGGFRQVTLAGRPLYTFALDAGKRRRTTGEGVVSFGGTWHVVGTPSASTPPMTAPTTTTTSTTTTTPYYP